MKAVISDRIYLETTPEKQREIDTELTYSIPSFKFGDPPQIIKNMALIKQTLVSMPVGREDLIPSDYEIVDKTSHRLCCRIYKRYTKIQIIKCSKCYE